MDRLDSKIVLSGQEFCFSTEVVIESSYDNLVDTAEVVIPKKIRYVNNEGSEVDAIVNGKNPLFNIGDPGEIWVGYNSLIEKCFTGYITGVRQKFPLRFKLEDEIYNLKQNTFTISLDNPTLSELLALVIPDGVDYEVTADQNLGKWRISDASTARILDELRKKHGVYSFFRAGKLYCGFAVVQDLQNVHRFTFNSPNLITGDGLSYLDAKERRIKVICKSIDRNNNQLEASAGDADGEVRTVYFNNYSLNDLQDSADRLKDELKYSGFEGSFTIFATPLVNHGDVVELINETIPEQNGGYLVSKVKTYFGWSQGGRQDVFIKQKIYDLEFDGWAYIQKPITDIENANS